MYNMLLKIGCWAFQEMKHGWQLLGYKTSTLPCASFTTQLLHEMRYTKCIAQ